MSRSARRREQHELARELRERGLGTAGIARALRDRYGLDARLAARTACGWSQADTARAWTARWPDEPKTFKNVSYWENWPSPTGHAPSLAVLDRLAQLYRCDVADLVAGWGEHGPPRDPATPVAAEPESLAWQVEHLDLHELARAMADWAQRIPAHHRHALLLKLGTAASLAAGRSITLPAAAGFGRGPATSELAGRWTSTYTFFSTGRDEEFEGRHDIELRAVAGRLVGRSEMSPTGSVELDLRQDGLLVTGTWTERTTTGGYYGGAVYHGVMQLVLDPTGRSMRGRWLGPDREFAVDSGIWALTRCPT